MKRSNSLGIVIVVVVLIALGFLIFGRGSENKSNDSTNTQTSQPAPNSADSNASATPAAGTTQSTANTITYDGSGFSPAKITVKSGDSVTIKNTSSSDVQFKSDPHPVHTDNQDLNVGDVPGGQSQTFTVTKKGTFGFHNHLDPSQTGTIVVQ